MPNRWNLRTRRKRYAALVARDGEACRYCARRPPDVRLEIDHIDGNVNDDHLANLRLLCKPCNVADGEPTPTFPPAH